MADLKFKILTLGCKVNQYDSQEIRERFLEAGWREAAKGQQASVYIINTCTVTQKADRDSLYYIRRSFRENPSALIVVTGCLTELDSKQLKKEQGVGLIIKNRDKGKIVSRVINRNSARSGISFFEGRTRAFLKIQDGCNNFCSYCKVPLVRGVSRSKPLSEVMREARQLVASGYCEIVLTGICLGSYGKDLKPGSSLVTVIDSLEAVEGLHRIRLSSIEAKDVSDQLIGQIARSKKLCRHLHIPIQSGDNEILRSMHRKYTGRDYLRLVQELKKACPGIAITTDVLAGYPGEEERHFRNTMDLVKKIMPLRTHIFPFSPREGTQAFVLKNQVAADIVKDRVDRMRHAAEICAAAYRKKFLSKIMPVLIETRVKGSNNMWEGHTDNYLKVRCRSSRDLRNKLIPLRLEKIGGGEISGILP
ncbi:MAG: tRNA (N(6)-L-threonylcarbamoyladenosine(37)-C(2))-methylthiotransferase MtaB [Candidatus Omnitrophota bacterium]